MSATTYRIESAIPIPKQAGRSRYPWRSLQISQSFFVQAIDRDDVRRIRDSLSSCRRNAQRSTGRVFVLREICQNDVRGIRVWRTK